MFWLILVCAYLCVGIMCAGITITVFPPLEGFRPKRGTVILAIVTFTLLWPVLVGLALWYGVTSFIQRAASTSQKDESASDESHRLTISKPR